MKKRNSRLWPWNPGSPQIKDRPATPAPLFPALLRFWTRIRRASPACVANARIEPPGAPRPDAAGEGLPAVIAADDEARWLDALNMELEAYGFTPVGLGPSGPPRLMRLRGKRPRRIEFGAIVSVILYAHDADAALEQTTASILDQTWRPLEVIIVDDGSAAATQAIAIDLVQRDARVRLLTNPVSLGRGAADYRALAFVSGHYVTSLAAGDWAHPEWIERFLAALLDQGAGARAVTSPPLTPSPGGVSGTQRAGGAAGALEEQLRQEGIVALVETSFLRECLKQWDSTRTDGMAELVARLTAAHPEGCAALRVPGVLLSAAGVPVSQANLPSAEPADRHGSEGPVGPEPTGLVSRARMSMQSAPPSGTARPDRVIWMYWTDSGSGRARPPYLEVCLESVRRRSGCEVRVCDEVSARELLPELPDSFLKLIPAHQADLFRIGILAKFGGMYVDFDTFVLHSLAPLFDCLDEHELFVTDWRPRHRDPREWYPVATGILGPARPSLPLMRATFERQLEALRNRADALALPGPYPIAWTELLDDIFVRCYFEHQPEVLVRDGAATWYAVSGGTDWYGGNLLHPLRSMQEIGGELPDSELFTIANSLLPDDVKYASVSDLIKHNTILAHLLRQAAAPGEQ